MKREKSSTGVQSKAAAEDSKSILLASNKKFMSVVQPKKSKTKIEQNAPES